MRKKVTLCLVMSLLLGIAVVMYVSKRIAAQAQKEPEIVLFWGDNFTGRSVSILDTVFDLPTEIDDRGDEINWNDEVRSLVVVSGTWRLYQNGRCNTKLDDTALENLDVKAKDPVGGWSTLISATSQGPLEIPYPAIGGFWRDISSIELVSQENLPDWAFDFRR